MALQPSAPLKQLQLLLAAVVPLLRLSVGASCSVDVPAGAWPIGAAKEAALEGSPKFTVPHVGSGFNRTLDIDGFCANLLYTSEAFDCNEKAPGELQLNVKAENGVFLRFDNANCPLSAISIRRTAPGSLFGAEMRFQFETCEAAAGAVPPPVTAATISVGLKEGKSQADSASFVEGVGRNSNLMPWLTEACDWEKEKPTEAPKANTLVLNVQTTSALVGNGTCGGPEAVILKTEKQDSKVVCREQCTTSITKAKENNAKAACSGFSYEAENKTCTLYTGAITAVNEVKGTECYSESLVNQDKAVVTTPTPKSALETGLQKQALHMREVFGGDALSSKTAKLEGIFAPDDTCFKPAWWFTLQDATGTPMSIDVIKENYIKLMAKLPAYNVTTSKVVGATVELDTVLVRGCQASSVALKQVTWGRDCLMPAAKTVCDSKELVNAIITGTIVPFAACWIIRLVYNLASGGAREEFGVDQDHPKLPLSTTLVLCGAAVLVVAALAAGSSSLVSLAFGLNGCLHGSREVIVVSCASGLATLIALLVALLYTHFSFKEVQKTAEPPPLASPKQSKLMLVESYDGGRTGKPINPDIMASGQFSMSQYAGPDRFIIE